jgi:alpha-beta hydrolase superfamily lysophospholipase
MRKTIIALHGIGLHHSYLYFVKNFFEEHGFAVLTPDLPGFGKTTSHNRGDIDSFHTYTKEIAQLSKEVRTKNPKEEIIIWGENMGGTIALMYGIEYPKCPQCIIAVNPILSTQLGFSQLKQWQLHLASQFSHDKRIEFPFLLQDLTDDEKVSTTIASDELVCQSITTRFWLALSQACLFLYTDAHRLTTPFLIQYSKNSNLILEKPIEHFYTKASATPKLKESMEGPVLLSLSRKREELFKKALSFIELVSAPSNDKP